MTNSISFSSFSMRLILLAILFIPVSSLAQETCGDIIYPDFDGQGNPVDFREPVVDCSNLFGIVDSDRVIDVHISNSGETLSSNQVIVLDDANSTLNLAASYNHLDEGVFNPTDGSLQLFQHDGPDYRVLELDQVVGSGTYTVVHTVEFRPVVGTNWYDNLRDWLIPTVHAQGFGEPLERTAVTFSVEFESVEPECGSLISVDENGNELSREVVTDCDNPFEEFDGDIVSNPILDLMQEPFLDLEEGIVVPVDSLPEFVSFSARWSVPNGAASLMREAILYQHASSGDYISYPSDESELLYFAPVEGTYTLVSSWFTSDDTDDPELVERVAVTFEIEEVNPEPQGASSVLFLPGMQASRLYRERVIGTEDRVWEPQGNLDALDLVFTANGSSVENVYTRDVIDEFRVTFGNFGFINIYSSLVANFSQLETDSQIEEFLPFAYDWRYSVFDVATDDVAYADNEIKRLKAEIERMAVDSHSEKVTIIAHSNGGLVLKALLASYPDQEFINKIDKVVMVGTPQLGAPKAIASLLHGYDQGIPLVVNSLFARSLALNFPGAYGLLPTAEYLTSGAVPTVFFDTSVSTAQFRSQYGNAINGPDELVDFLLGQEGRGQADTIEAAALLSETLLVAKQGQSALLDDFDMPDSIDFYTIVGTGKETEVAFMYREFSERICRQEFLIEVCETEIYSKPTPVLSLDGDGTVPAVSAAYDGIIHYVDLRETLYDHKNLTEVSEILSFIENVVLDEDITVNDTVPVYAADQLLIGIHSPMNILVTDTEGNQSGISGDKILTNIPNSSYRELAGSKYVTVPANTTVDIVFAGTANGGATVTIDEFGIADQEQRAVISIPVVASSTRSTISIVDGAVSNLETDIDGDGVIDEIRTPEGELVTMEPNYSYTDLHVAIASVENNYVKRYLKKVANKAEYYNQHAESDVRYQKIEQKLLSILQNTIKWLDRKRIVNSEVAEELIAIIKALKS